jgi:16S rRNA G966 N2-methylase RsmD
LSTDNNHPLISPLISQLLSSEVQSFINEHQHADPNEILLKYRTISGVPVSLVVDQLVGRKKVKEKIPSWHNVNRLIFPPSLNIEQSSSEETALNKVKILQDIFGSRANDLTLLDLTGGLGVDGFFFSKVCREIHLVEPSDELLKVVKHNFNELGVKNVVFHNNTAEEFLETLSGTATFGLIYIDPSRRTTSGQKVFSLSQCEPDVIRLQARIWQVTAHLLIKTSPLLDISQGLSDIRDVRKVSVVSVRNECKELLFYCEKNFHSEPVIEAINLGTKTSVFSFSFSDEQTSEAKPSDPLKYLYEPNASLLKSGAFKIISSAFNLYKLHPNTHLYTSETIVSDFPGRIFKIISVVKPDPKVLTAFFEDGKANIFARNYPLSVSELRKKTGLKEGGDKFLIGCSGLDKKFLIVAERLNGE